MKRFFVSLILCGIFAVPLVADNVNNHATIIDNTRAIYLETETDVVTFGDDVTLKVSYQNHDATAWELKDRNALQDTLIQFVLSGSQEPPKQISWLEIAYMQHKEQGIRSIFKPPASTSLIIAPGDRFDFVIQLSSAMVFRHLTPGEHYELWMADTKEKLESNKVGVHFKLTIETMGLALKKGERVVPAHDALTYLQWLRKFTPVDEREKFALSPKELQYPAIRKENKKALETYRNYFSNPANIHAIQTAIHRVNTQSEEALNKRKDVENQTDTEILVHGNTDFAVALYHKLNESTETDDDAKNVFFSPYSISTALAMTYAGARGNTEKEMAETLRFSLAQEKLHPAFAQIESRLSDVQRKGEVKLGVANSLWPDSRYKFTDSYMSLIKKYYGVTITSFDYQHEYGTARAAINHWVEEKTQGRIKDLLQPLDITDLTRMVLVNAIYFKGDWTSPFKADKTKDAPFHVTPQKPVQVPMMTQEESFNHADLEFFDMLELPYAGGDLSMLVMLPKTHDNLAQLEASLSTENLQLWEGQLEEKNVAVSLPKFKTTCRFDLVKTLKSMGMMDAFSSADFSGMDGTRSLHISAVIHKAFVDVNEEGTEAAAATAVVLSLRSLSASPTIFRVDHPFVFVIQDNQTGSILFMGRVNDPTKTGV